MEAIYIKFPGKKALPITFSAMQFGKNSLLQLYYLGQPIATLGGPDPVAVANALHEAADKLMPVSIAEAAEPIERPATWKRQLDPSTMTPGQVIAYFEQSPVLASMAEDVRAAIGHLVSTPIEGEINHDIEICRGHRSELFNHDGTIKWGAQTKIANILNIKNAGGHRERIQKVLVALKTTSTTPTSAPAMAMAA